MNGSLTRSAIGCAIACGAFVVGPSLLGTAVANADLAGIGGGGVTSSVSTCWAVAERRRVSTASPA